MTKTTITFDTVEGITVTNTDGLSETVKNIELEDLKEVFANNIPSPAQRKRDTRHQHCADQTCHGELRLHLRLFCCCLFHTHSLLLIP